MQNLVEIGQIGPEILQILINLRWRLYRHFGSSSNVKLIGNIYIASMHNLQNLVEIGQVVLEILKILVNPRWQLCRHFGCGLKVKTHRKHIHSLSATTCKIE